MHILQTAFARVADEVHSLTASVKYATAALLREQIAFSFSRATGVTLSTLGMTSDLLLGLEVTCRREAQLRRLIPASGY